MDKVHDVQGKPWIARNILRIKDRVEYIRNSTVDLGHDGTIQDKFEELSGQLDKFANDESHKLRSHFSFNIDDEKFLTNDPECKLKTYLLQLEHAKRMISERNYRVKYLTSLKTKRKEVLMRYQSSMGQKLVSSEPDEKHVILAVQIWHQPSRSEKVCLEREILFRADQCLVELRDQFKCYRDYGVPMDLSDDPDQQIERIYHGELFKSGFFLIENTFYNDMRDPNNADLSATILNWATSRHLGTFERKRMEETRFEDLSIRLGYPYLYCHQGNCEHLFTISDIRYASVNMCYPQISACSIGRKEHNLKCYMCRLRPPHWYTRNNSRLPLDPYFFCETCFRSFNYNEDKKKIGNFQAYLYTNALGIPDSLVISSNDDKT